MASLMGASVHMVAKVGDDDIGRATISNFRSRGVSTEHVSVATGVASGIAAVSVSADGQNSIVLAPGANLLLGRDDVERAAAAILGSDVLLLQNEAGPAPRARGCAGAVVAAPRARRFELWVEQPARQLLQCPNRAGRAGPLPSSHPGRI